MTRLAVGDAAALAAALPGQPSLPAGRRHGGAHRRLRAPRLEGSGGDPTRPRSSPRTACRFAVTLGGGHKTGLYLDQRENRPAVAAHAAGRRVLDAFCLHRRVRLPRAPRRGHRRAARRLLRGGARRRAAQSRAERRRRPDGTARGQRVRRAPPARGATRALRPGRAGPAAVHAPEGCAWTRRRGATRRSTSRGLRLLEPGGVLATFSCSHHVTPALFEDDLPRRRRRRRRHRARARPRSRQARDHPVLLTVPETRYLTGLLLQAV